jgi:hypothetical protein
MEAQTHYVGALIGRVFLITTKKAIEEWGGIEDEDGQSDYDSIIDHVEAEEAGLDFFSKRTDLVYLTFFSMSSKIEIFKSSKGIVLCEGLFFNESWDYTKQIIVEDLEETSKRIDVDEQLMVIIDAAVDGRNLSLESSENSGEYCAVQLENGVYKVIKIQVRIEIGNNYLERMGIELSKI